MAKKQVNDSSKKVAIVLVRGLINVKHPIRDTLALLHLTRKNHCVVVDKNPVILGMIQKIKDYITWGEIDDDTHQNLIKMRGEEYLGPETDSKKKIKYNNKFNTYNNKNYKKYYRLNPPKKGYGRKGIKTPFNLGGALGYRGEKIND